MLRSNLHGKVLEIADNNEKPGTPIILWKEHGGSHQKWKIVPLGAWEDYELMMANGGEPKGCGSALYAYTFFIGFNIFFQTVAEAWLL